LAKQASNPGKMSPPSKTGKTINARQNTATNAAPDLFTSKRSQGEPINKARYRPSKPRYVPTNNVQKC
jgi:hypothetical protein